MNKFIKSYSDFINEGAKLTAPNFDKVELSWLNTPDLPVEVLKSNSTNELTGFRKIGTPKDGSFQIYYGLTVDPERSEKLGEQDPLFKMTLDTLKKSNILNSRAALSAFTDRTTTAIKSAKGKIDWVVSLGSTENLSNDLGEVISKKFGAKHIVLPKNKFKSIVNALDWDYITDYETRAEADPKKKPILASVKADILRQVDDENTDPFVIDLIKSATSVEELVDILDQARADYLGPDIKNSIAITWKTNPFIIRSSGISRGGSRTWFKKKYALPGSEESDEANVFKEAMIRCITGSDTMLFVDDNSRTKSDLSDIFDSVIEVADEIFKNSQIHSTLAKNYHKRFLAYVLIYIPDGVPKDDSLIVKKLASSGKVDSFKAGGLDAISKWIEDDIEWLKQHRAQKEKNRQERMNRLARR